MLVLTLAYSDVLTSLLSVPKLEPIVNTLEDLVKGGQLRITLEKNENHMSRFGKLPNLSNQKNNSNIIYEIWIINDDTTLEAKKRLLINFAKIQSFWQLMPFKQLRTLSMTSVHI